MRRRGRVIGTASQQTASQSRLENPALILRSDREIASRRMLQLVPEPPGASFETPLTRLLRMRAE